MSFIYTPVNLSSSAIQGVLPVPSGGTASTSLTLNNVLLGNNTGALLKVAPGASGNILTSDGTTWASTTPSAPAGGGFTAMTLISSSGTFTIPTGKTTLKVTIVGAGGGGGSVGGGLGYAGNAGGNTTLSSGTQTISTITGGGGGGGQGCEPNSVTYGGSGGTASGGTVNSRGNPGNAGDRGAGSSLGGANGGSSMFGGGAQMTGGSGNAGGNYGGGGAGGRATSAGNFAAGGGGGGTAISYLTNVTPGNTLTITIGAGGTGYVSGVWDGGNGSAGIVIIEY
jgi:hypothetical protein